MAGMAALMEGVDEAMEGQRERLLGGVEEMWDEVEETADGNLVLHDSFLRKRNEAKRQAAMEVMQGVKRGMVRCSSSSTRGRGGERDSGFSLVFLSFLSLFSLSLSLTVSETLTYDCLCLNFSFSLCVFHLLFGSSSAPLLFCNASLLHLFFTLFYYRFVTLCLS
jgi:hypothetical protein